MEFCDELLSFPWILIRSFPTCFFCVFSFYLLVFVESKLTCKNLWRDSPIAKGKKQQPQPRPNNQTTKQPSNQQQNERKDFNFTKRKLGFGRYEPLADLPTRTAYARVESELGAEVFLGIYRKRWNLHGNLRVLPQCQPPAGRALLRIRPSKWASFLGEGGIGGEGYP